MVRRELWEELGIGVTDVGPVELSVSGPGEDEVRSRQHVEEMCHRYLIIATCNPNVSLAATTAHPGASQSLTDADREAIKAVWAEMDVSAMAGDLARLAGVYAENAVEVFQPDQISYGREEILNRIGSGIEGLRVSAHESRVEGILGEGDAAMVWVKNTQTHVNRETGAERSYDLDFAAVMSREADGSWKIAYFRFVWPD